MAVLNEIVHAYLLGITQELTHQFEREYGSKVLLELIKFANGCRNNTKKNGKNFKKNP